MPAKPDEKVIAVKPAETSLTPPVDPAPVPPAAEEEKPPKFSEGAKVRYQSPSGARELTVQKKNDNGTAELADEAGNVVVSQCRATSKGAEGTFVP